MSDLFSSYGQTAKPDRVRPVAPVKPLGALELKMREKQRLSRSFRKWRRSENQFALQSEPRLRDFMRYLRTVDATKSADLIDAIDECDWLRTSPLHIRIFALRMISARCDKINQSLGFEPLDDPLPPDQSLYLRARDRLHPGGKM